VGLYFFEKYPPDFHLQLHPKNLKNFLSVSSKALRNAGRGYIIF